jgi:hypothetical protein
MAGYSWNIPTRLEVGADACLTTLLDFGPVRREIERRLAYIEA